jgi:eukaryotic-like serine/threonine-protein kinase
MLGQPMIGRILGGRYRVIQNLSAGGFGHTYIAEDSQRPGSPKCVVKHLSFSSHNPDLIQQARRMFQQEAEALERLGQHDRIPRLLAYFEEAGEFYLVQELIEGRSLSEELKNGQTLPKNEVLAILDDVLEILQFVHGQGVIHRDLKPENLIRRQSDGKLVLIDFGAVKTMDVLSTMPDPHSVPVYTTGYAASEQCLGQPRFASDLYALGMIAIQALSGVHPTRLQSDPNTGNPVWRSVTQLDDWLKNILNQLTEFHFGKRFQNATDVRQAIKTNNTNLNTTIIPEDAVQATPNPSRLRTVKPQKLLPIVLAGCGLIIAALFATQRLSLPGLKNTTNELQTESLPISGGEQVLHDTENNPQRQTAAEYIKRQKFPEAIAVLKKLRAENRSYPEDLIRLHNAEIGNRKAYTIAAVVPLNVEPNFANEMLRGIAQAQHELNAGGGIAGVPVKVMIADDRNQPELAQQIARSLVANPDVLSVVGHGTSQTTYAVAKIYQEANLPIISPLSSAENLADFKQYLFRTIPSDRRAAKQLADYAVKQLKKQKIAVFYNAEDPYSQSLKQTFQDALDYGYSMKPVDVINLNKPDFDAGEALTALKAKKVDALFLATNKKHFEDAMTIVQANDNQLPLLAGETFYAQKTLNIGQKDILGMVLAVPAQQLDLNASKFQTQAKQLWGQSVTWRSALSYDATQALFAGLKQAQTRADIRTLLANPQFQSPGATQTVKFSETGDRAGSVKLLQVVKDNKTKTFVFKPMQP